MSERANNDSVECPPHDTFNTCTLDSIFAKLQMVQFNVELCELGPKCITHRVISDRVHRLLVTLSYFRPDRFVQLLSLIPILILLLYYLVSGCLTSLC